MMLQNTFDFNEREDMLELMFQHVQFRRIEKFFKNYFDAGKVISENNIEGEDKIL
jgi:hypothetical protein